MQRRTMVLLSLAVLLLAVPAWGADVAKIGLVDFQRILDTSEAGKAAQAQINSQGQEMKADLEQRGKALQEERERFENVEKLTLDKAAQNNRAKEINDKILEFQKRQQQYAQKAQKLQFVHISKIRDAITRIGQEIGKREGYLLIIEKKEAGVIYAPTAIDITEQVIKEYNRTYGDADKKK